MKSRLTHVGGLIICKSSDGELGTLRIIIRRPSVEPIPIDASDRTDEASENRRVEPPSLKMYEPDRTRWANWGANSMFGLEKPSEGSPGRCAKSAETLVGLAELIYLPSLKDLIL